MNHFVRATKCLLGCGLLAASLDGAGGWSTFRGDAQRSGITAESLELPLTLAWKHQPVQPPTPAWPEPASTNYAILYGPLRQTLTFDRAFHVVADAESVYFGSSSEDAVFCLDAATGAVRWRFVTEGPVRLPPVLHQGTLMVGSDDGHLYALEARTGRLRWKYRAGSRDQRLPGNGRIISLWPVRGGLAADAGVVYFAAGLFPEHGVYLCAVSVADGRPVFKRPLDFTAQGTILASADQLFVATGRTAFWGCDRKTGRPLVRYGRSDPWKTNLVGGSFALLVDGVLATGPSEDGQFHWFNSGRTNPIHRVRAESMIASSETLFLLGQGKLSAQNRAAYLGTKGSRRELPPLWSVEAGSANTMIMAGDKLVAAGPGELAVYGATKGVKLWTTRVDGTVEGLVFCNRRLYASMDNGQTLCFQTGWTGPVATAGAPKTELSYPQNAVLADAAATAIRNAGVTKGYCLVLQAGTGQLAWEIARRSEFRVICQEENPARAEAMRIAFLSAGLYGNRIEVHQGPARDLPYPRGFANLIVSEGALTGAAALPPSKQVLRVLRPYGGTVSLMVRPGTKLERHLAKWGRNLPEWHVTTGDLIHGLARRGKPAGSGEWSHFYGDPGNTACSGDEMRAGPMEPQWFGRPGPADMVDRHKKGPAPLFVNGRLFVPGFDYVAALDAYNGTILWEKRIPDSVRVAAFKDSSSIAATDTDLLVAAGDSCLVFDAQTGATKLRIPTGGAPGPKAWGYLAAVDGLVIGSTAQPGGSLRRLGKAEDLIIWRNDQPVVCSSSVFACGQTNGRPVWEYPARFGAIINPSLTIGSGRIYFIESSDRRTLQSKDGRLALTNLLSQGAHLVALNLTNGAPLWTQEVDLAVLRHVLFMSYAKEMLVISGTHYATVDPAETKGRAKPHQLKRVRYELFAFDARTGAPQWKGTGIPSYDEVLDGAHGEQVQHPAIVDEVVYGPGFAFYLLTGQPYLGWKWQKSHKCATLSTSRYCAFSRFTDAKLPYVFDLKSGQRTSLSIATRPGCWINTIPAGGLVLIPEGSAGCTCEYPFQTSLALAPAERQLQRAVR